MASATKASCCLYDNAFIVFSFLCLGWVRHSLPARCSIHQLVFSFPSTARRASSSESAARRAELGERSSESRARRAELGEQSSESRARRAQLGEQSSESAARRAELGERSSERELGERSSESRARRAELGEQSSESRARRARALLNSGLPLALVHKKSPGCRQPGLLFTSQGRRP